MPEVDWDEVMKWLPLARRMAPSEEAASDVGLPCILRCLSRWDGDRPLKYYLRAALWREYRKRRGKQVLQHRGEATWDKQQLEDRDSVQLLWRELPKYQRLVLHLRFFDDMTYEEMAAFLGYANKTSAMNLVRDALVDARRLLDGGRPTR